MSFNFQPCTLYHQYRFDFNNTEAQEVALWR